MIALLIALGVDLAVVLAVAVFVLGRRRWLKRQPGEFAGAIRVSGGVVEGLSAKWKHGSGRWVRDVLVWSKAPFMFRNELVPVDRSAGEHPAHFDGVKRLGGNRSSPSSRPAAPRSRSWPGPGAAPWSPARWRWM